MIDGDVRAGKSAPSTLRGSSDSLERRSGSDFSVCRYVERVLCWIASLSDKTWPVELGLIYKSVTVDHGPVTDFKSADYAQ
jgi:hypothetical protein